MSIKQSSLLLFAQILTVQSPIVRKIFEAKGCRSMAMTGPRWQLNLITSFSTRFWILRFTLITRPFSVPTRNLLLIVGSYCNAVTPIAPKMSARSGSSRFITSTLVGRLSFLMSHHLIVPSVDAEKNSVLVLDTVQNAWFAGFLCAPPAKMREEMGVTGITVWQRNGRALWKAFCHSDGRNRVYKMRESWRSVTLRHLKACIV